MMFNNQYPTHNRVFTLNRIGYDPFIDFLKGICIIFVIINHCMPVKVMEYTAFFFWGVSAVPIFLIIQVFHAYKRGVNNATINYRRLWKKIIYPFLICELIIFIIVSVRYQHTNFYAYISDAISFIKYGGYGPGAYYPWIYIQFALILPIIVPIFRLNTKVCCLVFIIISQITETVCSYYEIHQVLYRLLFFRYIFIFFLGYLLVKKGYVLNKYTLMISILCLVISSYITYSNNSFSPILYPFVNPVCHWFCYIYIAYLLLFLLKTAYNHLKKVESIMYFFSIVGKFSYEIFLFKMFYFSIVYEWGYERLHYFVINNTLLVISNIFLSILLCTIPVLLYKKISKQL